MSHVDYYPSLPDKRRQKTASTHNPKDRLLAFRRHIAMIRGKNSTDMVVDLLSSIAMEITTNRMSSEDSGHLLSCIMAELQLCNCQESTPEFLSLVGLNQDFLAGLKYQRFTTQEDE